MPRLPVIGGPADGGSVAAPAGSIVRYLDASGERGFAKPGPGRSLYVLDRLDSCWRYSPGVRTCSGCQAIVLLPLPCPVCGAPVASRGAAELND